MSLPVVISSIVFVLFLGIWFWRERGRWNKYQATNKMIDDVLPQLVAKAATRYQAKFGRPPSILESIKQR